MYTAQILTERIKLALKNSGKKQKEVLLNCGANENTLNQLSDKKGLSSFTLAKISDELDCSVDYLLGRTWDSKSHKEKETPSINPEGKAQKIINIFLNLNDEGQKQLLQQAENLAEIDKYKKCADNEQNVG